jgi:glycosyltransferase involved in cell wall biosynthesis
MVHNKVTSLNSYDVYIPTKNSIRWIGIFLKRYRELGIEPLYVVDERSIDDTLGFLQDSNARVVTILPRDNFAEAGMIEFAANFLRKEWVLRIDDDEFPSINMLEWLEFASQNSTQNAWSISRRDVSLNNGQFVYSNWPTRKVFNGESYIHNPQLRFYRTAAVSYIEKLHTPGFEVRGSQSIAPNSVYFIHCARQMKD